MNGSNNNDIITIKEAEHLVASVVAGRAQGRGTQVVVLVVATAAGGIPAATSQGDVGLHGAVAL